MDDLCGSSASFTLSSPLRGLIRGPGRNRRRTQYDRKAARPRPDKASGQAPNRAWSRIRSACRLRASLGARLSASAKSLPRRISRHRTRRHRISLRQISRRQISRRQTWRRRAPFARPCKINLLASTRAPPIPVTPPKSGRPKTRSPNSRPTSTAPSRKPTKPAAPAKDFSRCSRRSLRNAGRSLRRSKECAAISTA